MPYRKLYLRRKKNYRKKNPPIRRSSMRNRPSTSIIRSPSSLPDRMFVKLKYTDVFTLSSSTSIASQIMRGNGMYDPDQSGVGHQPLGFDQWQSFYKKFYVIGSSCKAKLQGTTNSGIVMLRPQLVTTTGTVISTELEKPRTRYALTQTGGSNQDVLSGYMNTLRIFGRPKTEFGDLEFTGTMASSDPPQIWYWVIASQNADESSNFNVNVVVEVVYYAMLTDRVRLGQS